MADRIVGDSFFPTAFPSMERAFKGNEQVKNVMERSATDLTQTSHTLEKQLQKAIEQARTRTKTRERER